MSRRPDHHLVRSVAFAAVLFASSIAAPAAQAPAAAAPAGNAATGKALYTKHTCFFCHGTAGQGGIAGARLAVVARNTQSFIRYVRRPSGQMPAFTETILSDQALADILAYVKALPAAKTPAEIPLLNQLLPKPPL
jgi:mono/diheme cytochrome c family protein